MCGGGLMGREINGAVSVMINATPTEFCVVDWDIL